MCGICGKFYSDKILDIDKDINLIWKMCKEMHHRGPAEKNVVVMPSKKGVLGSSRLKIIDLYKGIQPIVNESKEIYVCLNGEIYNYIELREKLIKKGHIFSTSSDTEIIVHLYEEKRENFVDDLIGMFAISIWDEMNEKLILIRDRLGKKPLVYSVSNGNIIFSSAINSLLFDKNIEKNISENSVSLYFTYNFIPAPHTIFKDVMKLPSAHMLIWKNGNIEIKKYWDIDHSLEIKDNEEDIKEKLFYLLEDSTKIRLRSDVDVGVFLSGGLDSSTVSFFVNKVSNKRIKFFSIGFKEEEFNELPYAEIIVKDLQLEHIKLVVEEKIFDLLEKIFSSIGEPFADSSLIPTYYICKEAKKFVTVCLSGDGGDEIFCGYDKYMDVINKTYLFDFLRFGKNFLDYLKSKLKEKYFLYQSFMYLNKIFLNNKEWYLDKISFFNKLEQNLLFSDEFKKQIKIFDDPLYKTFSNKNSNTFLKDIIYVELFTTLPDSLLAKVDIASMANSLEIRAPLCDHRLVEYLYSLPLEYKINKNGDRKIILKNLMKNYLPEEILYKKKAGFVIPLNEWLRKNLNSMFQESLNDNIIKDLNYFNLNFINSIYNLHKEKKINRGRSLFAYLIFYLWLRNLKNKG